VSVGAIAHHKDPLSIISIARIITQQQDDIHFVLFGDGPLRRRVTFEVSRQCLSKMVHIVGDSNNVHDMLLESDVLVLPSLVDSMPLVILEAMARGIPVIAARVGSIDEVIHDTQNGFLVERDDEMVQNFVNNILFLKENEDLYERIKSEALIKVEEELDVDISVNKYINVFDEILAAQISISQ